MRSPSLQQRGFSLVEITIALGVAAVTLVSLLALLGVAADSNRIAGRDTATVSMTQQVLADLRAANFDAVWLAEPRNEDGTDRLVKPAAGAEALNPAPSVYLFTADGTLVSAAEAASNTEVAYRCTVRKVPDLASRTANDGPFNLLRMELVFTPSVAAASTAALQRQVVHASLARY